MSMFSRLVCAGAVLALTASLGGCLIVSADVKGDIHDDDRGYPRLLGAEVGWRAPEVTIVASSSGCTDKEQFTYEVRHVGDHEARVGFRRIADDRCKAFMPEGKRLTWTFDELGVRPGERVRVMNPIGR